MVRLDHFLTLIQKNVVAAALSIRLTEKNHFLTDCSSNCKQVVKNEPPYQTDKSLLPVP